VGTFFPQPPGGGSPIASSQLVLTAGSLTTAASGAAHSLALDGLFMRHFLTRRLFIINCYRDMCWYILDNFCIILLEQLLLTWIITVEDN
jgi:hypothetical protein